MMTDASLRVRSESRKQSVTAASDFTIADQLILSEAKNYCRWLYRLVEPFIGRRVLEIGCGIGNFTELLKEKNCQVLAVDINAKCIEHHRSRFADVAHVRGITLDATSDGMEKLKAFQPDTIVCLNVLEHIADDEVVLRRMHRVLSHGGALCLLVPAFEALRGPIDEQVGHYRRYSRHRLLQACCDAGFRLERLRYVNAVGFFGWWMNSKVFKRRSQSPFQVNIFDRVIVPILWRVERFVPPPFGQSIFVVARKERF